ncbi:MAG TPA: HD-GYP domain-containing protein, partial [Candidatus Limnocylindrales bacterium]|nr:HD-GYP domain-containing protein [Candidatus Limnocylindrales bacterium]
FLRPMPSRVAVFVAAVAALAAASILLPSGWTAPPDEWLAATAILALSGLLLEFVEVPTPNNGTLSVSGVAHVAIVLIAPAPQAALVVGATVAIHQLVTRRPPLRVVFNVANHVLTVSLASAAVALVGAPRELILERPLPWGYLAAALAGGTYYAANVGLTAVVVSLATRRRFRYVLRTNNRSTLLPDLGATTLGVLLAASWHAMPAWVVVLGVPTAVIARTLRIIRRLERETIEAVETLADSIDERDATTFHHSDRVSQYAVALARAMKLDDGLVDLIGLAARVHDLGKMGVRDAVLLKPTRLASDEEERMREHPEIGARILSRYGLYRDGAALVRAHHERWDGTGYPDGLAGEQIPLGARVIAVADAFDAMTSDRPYRAALHPLTAIEELRRGAGAQWDPVVVAHFIRLVTDPASELPDTEALRRLRDGSAPPPRPAIRPVIRPALRPVREAS